MAFVQVALREDSATPSGAPLRNRANFAALSKLHSATPRRVYLRRDPAARGMADTVAPLMAEDVASLVETCGSMKPELVLIEGVQLLQAAVALRAAHRKLPIIIDMHNIESVLREDIDRARIPRAVRSLVSIFLQGRWNACQSAERLANKVASQIWVCSQDDRERLLAIVGSGAVRIVPNPIPNWAEHARAAPHDSMTSEVLFVGHLAYPPNVEAVTMLVEDVMPRLRMRLPHATLHICGRRPRRRLARMVASEGHRLSADVDDLVPIYRSAGVIAIPLQTGGGSRLKILEAMAAVRPIVATAKAMEGLGAEAGVHYHPAETADQFADALARVLTDAADERANLLASRDWVIRQYGEVQRSVQIKSALEVVAS